MLTMIRSTFLLGILLIVQTACSEEKPEPPQDPNSSKIENSLKLNKSSQDSIHTKVIYGHDNRLDLYQIQDPKWLQLAASTAALVRPSRLPLKNNNEVNLDTLNYGQEYNLCPEEPFREQNTLAFCSGFFVGDDMMMTAGHCIRSPTDCEHTAFVFGFSLYSPSEQLTHLPTSQVYRCSSIIKTQIDPRSGADFAVVRVDRPIVGRAPLKLSSQGSPTQGTELVVIGHPSGLPTKISAQGYVRSVKTGYMVASLDTYGGNSGSAVFNSLTGEVEGILVRGETDFVTKNNCSVSNVCSQNDCRGEDVTLISYPKAALQEQ